MPYKLDAQGNIATQEINGIKLPIFVHADGKEAALDGEATISTIARLNREAQGHRQAKEAAEAAFRPFQDAGLSDAAAAAKALEIVANLDAKKLVDAGEVEKVRGEAIRAVEAKYIPIVQKAEKLESQLNNHLIGGAFAGSKFVAEKFAVGGPAGIEIARALFERSFKVEEGKVIGYDANGSKLFSRRKPGEIADTDEAIELLVDTYPHKEHILKGTGASGGGASGGGQGAGGKRTITRAQFDSMPPNEQSRVARDASVAISD